ncbi:MAG TPA: hypothetical protein VFB27_12370 [Opitutaceae bacterium]|nr:hypothetical protein [Opitutaceae bacterium]
MPQRPRRTLLLVLFPLLLSAGCASVPITQKNLAALPARTDERDADLKRWTEAVWLCNAFLSSPERATLPPGRIDFSEQGMEFVSDSGRLPIRVRCTTWGDLLIPCHMAAQERSDGFVVGLVPPRDSRLLDNSFFKYNSGQPAPNVVIARLILHELTHSYFHVGTVDFYHGFTYYLEAVFLLHYRSHSQERLPFQTSREFNAFIKRKMAEAKQLAPPAGHEAAAH